MGYEMYRLLSLKKSFATGRKKKTKKQAGPVIIDLDEEDRQQELLKGKKPAVTGNILLSCIGLGQYANSWRWSIADHLHEWLLFKAQNNS